MTSRACELLMESGDLRQEHLAEALASLGEDETRRDPETVLVERGYVNVRAVAQALCRAYDRMDYILVGGFPIEPRLARRVGRDRASRLGAMPLVSLDGRTALVLVEAPLSDETRTTLTTLMRRAVRELPCPGQPVEDVVQACFDSLENRGSATVRLGEVLEREGHLERRVLEEAVVDARGEEMFLGEYLVRENLLDEETLFRVLAGLAGVSFLSGDDLRKRRIDVALARKTPPEYARHNRCIPVGFDNGKLDIVTIDPFRNADDLLAVYECERVEQYAVTTRDFVSVFRIVHEESPSDLLYREETPEAEEIIVDEVADDEERVLSNPRFLDLLVEREIVSADALRGLEGRYGDDHMAILHHLHHQGAAPRGTLCKAWGDGIGVAYLDLERTLFENHVVQKLPLELARRNRMILVYQFGPEITAAMANPADADAVETAQKVSDARIMAVFATPEEIEDAVDIYYHSDDSVRELLENLPMVESGGDGPVSMDEIEAMAGSEAVVEFTRSILLLGLKERASDIHIEPREFDLRIRYRIDGRLQERLTLDSAVLPPLVSRMKILAGADIVERRLPQDGRISLPLHDRSIDFRFSSIPTIYGEKVVLRILGQLQQREVPDLKELGFSRRNFDAVRRIINSPNGMFLVTGPTGSGKSTTLYAALKEMNTPDCNIVTAEDPVEYRLAGINQLQIRHNVGLDFSRALRAFLRQDPDIILVGELRDLETAKIASEAALTGHFVLGSLHTNSAIQAITRLVEMGVEPHLVAPAFAGVMAQRLVRRLCPECRRETSLSPEKLHELFGDHAPEDVSVFEPVGCEKCSSNGYDGRTAVHEVLPLNERIRAMVSAGATTTDIEEAALSDGFLPMHYDGVKKALRGLTAIDEVERATLTSA